MESDSSVEIEVEDNEGYDDTCIDNQPKCSTTTGGSYKRLRSNPSLQKKRKRILENQKSRRQARGKVKSYSYTGNVRNKANKSSGTDILAAKATKNLPSGVGSSEEQARDHQIAVVCGIDFQINNNCSYSLLYFILDQDNEIEELLRFIRFEEMGDINTRRTWQERQASHRDAWEQERRELYEKFISSQCYTQRACDKCSTIQYTRVQAIRCSTCKSHLCARCDIEQHLDSPFHRRMYISATSNRLLLATDFFDENWTQYYKGNEKRNSVKQNNHEFSN